MGLRPDIAKMLYDNTIVIHISLAFVEKDSCFFFLKKNFGKLRKYPKRNFYLVLIFQKFQLQLSKENKTFVLNYFQNLFVSNFWVRNFGPQYEEHEALIIAHKASQNNYDPLQHEPYPLLLSRATTLPCPYIVCPFLAL